VSVPVVGDCAVAVGDEGEPPLTLTVLVDAPPLQVAPLKRLNVTEPVGSTPVTPVTLATSKWVTGWTSLPVHGEPSPSYCCVV
jgi:hypothetical protein